MIDWLTQPFANGFYQRALLAAILIGFTNGYVSALVVLNKSALKVGSLSHTLLPGIAIAIFLFGLSAASAFFGALFAALLVGLLSVLIARNSRVDQDSALAILWTAAFAGGLILLNYLSVNQELENWLFGNITGLANVDLWTVFAISAMTLLFLTLFQRPLLVMLFEPNVAQSQGVPVRALNYITFGVLAVVLIASAQAVGVILALGMLVAPAATIFLYSNSTALLFWGGGILGATASATALVVAYWFNLPPGATIVVTLGLVFLASFLLSPKYGLLRQWLPRHHEHPHG
jgi:manganese/iron transport system permease protein/iron/zinc/copper transport system permease protein